MTKRAILVFVFAYLAAFVAGGLLDIDLGTSSATETSSGIGIVALESADAAPAGLPKKHDEDEEESAAVVDENASYTVTSAEEDGAYIISGVECILQNPELPNGCEVTSLAIALNYLGIEADKCDLAENYLPCGPIGSTYPEEAYIGDPSTTDAGYYCYAPVIATAAQSYLDANGLSETYTVEDVSGTSLEELFSTYIDNDVPVIIWATMYMQELSFGYEIDGVSYPSSLHCLVLYGYDEEENLVYVSDPLVGNTTYDLDIFADRFDVLGQQAVVVEEV